MCAYIPFGAGPRRCIGEQLAILEMQIHFFVIAREFELAYLGGAPPVLDPQINLRPGKRSTCARRNGHEETIVRLNLEPYAMKHDTLIAALDAARKTAFAVTYIEGEYTEQTVSYAQIHDRALALLHHFQAQGAGAGSEMILLLASNEQFVDAFWACQLGGIVAVPIAVGNTEEQRLRLLHVAGRLRNPFLCSGEKIFERYVTFAAGVGLGAQANKLAARAIFLDRLDDVGKRGTRHEAMPDDVAMIQFSSGSTSSPKGVQLTHRNITTNIDAIHDGTHVDSTDVALSWMPLTHDMGLIGFHLAPMARPIDHGLLSAEVFVRRPLLWVKKASEKGATVLGSPNFGYRHFLRAFEIAKADGIDLSRVRLIMNGAEPISPDLCSEFTAALAPCGLKASVMFPVYGLAEASLAVSFPPPRERHRGRAGRPRIAGHRLPCAHRRGRRPEGDAAGEGRQCVEIRRAAHSR